jgi:hypothetical protein
MRAPSRRSTNSIAAGDPARRAVSVSGRGSCPASSTIWIRTLLGPETLGQPMPRRRSIGAANMGFDARRPQDGRHRRHQAAGDWHLPKAQSVKTMASTARPARWFPLARVSVRSAGRRVASKKAQATSLTRGRADAGRVTSSAVSREVAPAHRRRRESGH